MPLTDGEKLQRKRERMIAKAREYQIGTYAGQVAKVFQKMIRAEAGASTGVAVQAVVDGTLQWLPRHIGECVCVTCGKDGPWAGGLAGMHTGHFIASRRQSILFEEANVAPQCSHCNRYRSGAPQEFRQWMLAVRGEQAVERLECLKHKSVTYTREALVDMKLTYMRRLKIAQSRMWPDG